MRQNTFLIQICLLGGAFVLVPTHTNAQCNTCNDNEITCVDETSFKFCKVKSDKVYTCPSNMICTGTIKKCVNADSGEKPACESKNNGCGICDGNRMFTCTSRTTYAQCKGKELTKNAHVCPEFLVCDSRGGEICKNECNRPPVLECDT